MTTEQTVDETKLLEQLNAIDFESEEVPPEVLAGVAGTGDNDEAKGKAGRRWKEIKDLLKTSKAVIETQAEALENKGGAAPAEQPAGGAPPPATQADPRVSSQAYLSSLQVRAMQTLRIADPANDLVKMEVQRLYNEDMELLKRQETAEQDAEGVFSQVVEEFPQMGTDDWTEVKKRLAKLDAVSRAEAAQVKSIVHVYLGENFKRFAEAPPSNGDKGKGKAGTSASAAAGVSTTKARGSTGVPLTGGPAGDGEPEPPATAEELKGMRALKIPETQVGIYRKAMKKKGKYQPS